MLPLKADQAGHRLACLFFKRPQPTPLGLTPLPHTPEAQIRHQPKNADMYLQADQAGHG